MDDQRQACAIHLSNSDLAELGCIMPNFQEVLQSPVCSMYCMLYSPAGSVRPPGPGLGARLDFRVYMSPHPPQLLEPTVDLLKARLASSTLSIFYPRPPFFRHGAVSHRPVGSSIRRGLHSCIHLSCWDANVHLEPRLYEC